MLDFIKTIWYNITQKNIKLFSESELETELFGRYGAFTDYIIDPKNEEKLFESLKGIEGLADYLKATIAKDILRYYVASGDDQRNMIRGGLSRTMFFRNKLLQAGKKFVNKRYM